MIVLYGACTLIGLWVLGFAVVQLFHCQESVLVKKSVLIYILFGFIGSVSLIMILGLFLPLDRVAVLMAALVVFLFAVNFKKIRLLFKQSTRSDKAVFLFLFIPLVVIGLPQLLRHELYTSVVYNNDFALYMASFDWLKTHSILAPVEYSLAYPFYSMARYMIDNTRIGTDVFGAVLCDLFKLEAYEVFPVLIVLSADLVMISVYEFIRHFTGNKTVALSFGLFAAVNGNLLTILLKQYVPQVLGASLLILAFYSIHEFFQSQAREDMIVCALSLSGVMAVYCEFAVYIVLFILMYLILYAAGRKNDLKSTGAVIGKLFCICWLMIMFNIFGAYKAVKFNLDIFTRVHDRGAADIDPYRGNMLGLGKIVGCLLGISDYLSEMDIFYQIALAAGCIVACALMIGCIVKDKGAGRKFTVVSILVFLGLECYFRLSKGAYQEYKGITSGSMLMIALLGYMTAVMVSQCKSKKFLQYGVITVFACVILYSMIGPMDTYFSNQITCDSNSMKLKDAVAQWVPEEEMVELDSSINIADYISASYALKDRAVNCNTNLSNLSYFQQFEDDDPSKYIIYPSGYDYSANDSGELLWQNNKYALVERDYMP